MPLFLFMLVNLIFVSLIIMTVVMILMAGPLMRYYLNKENAATSDKDGADSELNFVRQPEHPVA
jgi:hypothetical protein